MGRVKVISTSQAFTLPREEGTYTFAPENMFVAQGDFLGLATPGGEWKVLVTSASSTTAMFEGHEKDMNGDQFTPTKTLTRKELNLQATVQPGP